MLAPILLKSLARSRTNVIRRESLVLYRWLGSEASEALLSKDTSFMCVQRQSHRVLKPVLDIPFSYRYNHGCQKSGVFTKRASVWYTSKASVEVETASGVVRFSLAKPREAKDSSSVEGKSEKDVKRRVKMSKKAKINQLKLYRLMARKKMNSPNPEVRIRYKLEKAKRKETWLIEKLRKFDVPKAPLEVHDPEILTEEEKHYLKRTGEKKKHYVLVGRRGVFGGVVLNMHLHWKNHETVKVICRPCKPGQLQEYAEELGRLSKGIVIDIKSNSTIIFYRGKNYVQPEVMSPPDTLSKAKALEKYKYLQSLEHTSQFIEKLEKELEEYQDHLAKYKQRKESENAQQHSLANP